VVKLDKTNSSKSLKQGEEIHVPYYYESGFAQPKEEDNKFTIEVTATEEEKVIIKQKLIEKGILNPDYPGFNEEPKAYSACDGTAIPPTIETNERPFTKEEIKALDKPKKKGRPKKNA